MELGHNIFSDCSISSLIKNYTVEKDHDMLTCTWNYHHFLIKWRILTYPQRPLYSNIPRFNIMGKSKKENIAKIDLQSIDRKKINCSPVQLFNYSRIIHSNRLSLMSLMTVHSYIQWNSKHGRCHRLKSNPRETSFGSNNQEVRKIEGSRKSGFHCTSI